MYEVFVGCSLHLRVLKSLLRVKMRRRQILLRTTLHIVVCKQPTDVQFPNTSLLRASLLSAQPLQHLLLLVIGEG